MKICFVKLQWNLHFTANLYWAMISFLRPEVVLKVSLIFIIVDILLGGHLRFAAKKSSTLVDRKEETPLHYGLFTLHGNGTGTGTGNRTCTIGDNGSSSYSCLGTSVNISVQY